MMVPAVCIHTFQEIRLDRRVIPGLLCSDVNQISVGCCHPLVVSKNEISALDFNSTTRLHTTTDAGRDRANIIRTLGRVLN